MTTLTSLFSALSALEFWLLLDHSGAAVGVGYL
jgi:hypothetical protein